MQIQRPKALHHQAGSAHRMIHLAYDAHVKKKVQTIYTVQHCTSLYPYEWTWEPESERNSKLERSKET